MISRRNLFKRIAGAGAAVAALPFLPDDAGPDYEMDLTQASLENLIVSWDDNVACYGSSDMADYPRDLWPGVKATWGKSIG